MKPKGVIIMSEQQKLLLADTEDLSEEMIKQIRNYVAELKLLSAINNVPEELIPKDEEDLEKMLEEADEDIEKGNVVSFEEVKAELNKAL
jgi:hypothetical protein